MSTITFETEITLNVPAIADQLADHGLFVTEGENEAAQQLRDNGWQVWSDYDDPLDDMDAWDIRRWVLDNCDHEEMLEEMSDDVIAQFATDNELVETKRDLTAMADRELVELLTEIGQELSGRIANARAEMYTAREMSDQHKRQRDAAIAERDLAKAPQPGHVDHSQS